MLSPQVILREGQNIQKLYVIKSGEVSLTRNGQPQPLDTSFIREAGGFTFFGDGWLPDCPSPDVSPYTVLVASATVQLLCLPNRYADVAALLITLCCLLLFAQESAITVQLLCLPNRRAYVAALLITAVLLAVVGPADVAFNQMLTS